MSYLLLIKQRGERALKGNTLQSIVGGVWQNLMEHVCVHLMSETKIPHGRRYANGAGQRVDVLLFNFAHGTV